MKRSLLLLLAFSAWGCSDEPLPGNTSAASSATGSGGSTSSTSASSSSTGGAGGAGGEGGAPPSSLAACLDAPDALPRPPSGALPCEYIPPGLVLAP